MLDYRELPPAESAAPAAESEELPHVCSECDKELEYTYRVIIPSICSHCLQQHSMPNGARVSRNTRDMSIFARESPPGYHWDWTTQSHVPDKVIKPAETVSVAPGNKYTITVGPGGYTSYGGGGSGGTGGSHAGGNGTSVGGSGGGISGTVFHTVSTPDKPRDFYAKKTTGGHYTYSPGQDDPLDWSPSQIQAYLREHYSEGYLRENYSLLRQQLLYGKPGTYQFHAEPDEPEPEILSIHLPHSHLTGRGESAILNENDPKPEEQDMPMENILSRDEAEAAFQRASAALARLHELEQKYTPEPPNGSVIAFKLTFPQRSTSEGQRVYSYAAIKAAGLWFVTGTVRRDIPVGTGLEWTQLLSGLEQFHATEFEVLRTGGEAAEIEASKTVVLAPGAVTTAFTGESGSGDAERVLKPPFGEPPIGSDEDTYRNEAPEQ